MEKPAAAIDDPSAYVDLLKGLQDLVERELRKAQSRAGTEMEAQHEHEQALPGQSDSEERVAKDTPAAESSPSSDSQHERKTDTAIRDTAKPADHSPPDGRHDESASTGSNGRAESNVPASSRHTTARTTPLNNSDNQAEPPAQSPPDPQSLEPSKSRDDALPVEMYDLAGLHRHLQKWPWSWEGRQIISAVHGVMCPPLESGMIPQTTGPHADRSHFAHGQVFTIKRGGGPQAVETEEVDNRNGRAAAIWYMLSGRAYSESRSAGTWGRITILREPSPILFGALHYTMNQEFDMDEIFRLLYEPTSTMAETGRPWEDDERRQRSFVFTFRYLTLIGKDCEPKDWQLCTPVADRLPDRIALTRCSSVIALRLHGREIARAKNPARGEFFQNQDGPVFDPFSPWQILQLQCFPDWQSSLNVHHAGKRYMSGTEAFLETLLGEYVDASRRFDQIYTDISLRARPPIEVLFDRKVLLYLRFDDKEQARANHYFWCYNALDVLNESIRSMIESYRTVLTTKVWNGEDETLWPVSSSDTRYSLHKSQLEPIREAFDTQIAHLEEILEQSGQRQREILRLREELFNGTSIREAQYTYQQGQNIRLLTLVSVFFLPLSFVTSVFGMTNMPTEKRYWMFGTVLVAVCVPVYLVVAFINRPEWLRTLVFTILDFPGSCVRTIVERLRAVRASKVADSNDVDTKGHADTTADLPQKATTQSNIASMWKEEKRRHPWQGTEDV